MSQMSELYEKLDPRLDQFEDLEIFLEYHKRQEQRPNDIKALEHQYDAMADHRSGDDDERGQHGDKPF